MEREYIRILKELFLKHIPNNEYVIFLFGSRAEGKSHERSDVDVGVWGKNPLPPITRFQLEEAIENSVIPYLVDIVDFSRVGTDFKQEALKQIQLWNYPKNLSGILKA